MNAQPSDLLRQTAELSESVTRPIAGSRKVHVTGSRPDLRVPMREIDLSDTPRVFGADKNAPFTVYDTSGPYTDPGARIDLTAGLPALRAAWIAERGDTEQLTGLSSEFGRKRAADPRLANVRPNGMEDVPQFRVDVDWAKAGALGVPLPSIHNTLSSAFGGAYVNNFVQSGRVKKVYVQADAPFRMLPKDLERLYVRNNQGKMVPFSSFSSTRWTMGSPRLERFNGFPSMNIWGEPAPGRSSGEAMQAMEEITAKLPPGIGFDWAGLSYQERMATAQAPLLYAFSILVIFLCLAALYESWPIPISILLALPLGAIGGVLASSARGMHNDVYFQIGLLTTLGLTTKNAILIVQFAKARVQEGKGLLEATLEGARLRFRPIVMTSLAFGFGVLPLALASGAGAGAMTAIGTGVLGGMITGTVLVVVFAPLFYVLIETIFGTKRRQPVPQPDDGDRPSGQEV